MSRHRPVVGLIVGFPGESDADFEDTIRLVDEIGFASSLLLQIFAPAGTPAADLGEQVAPELMQERLLRLQERDRTSSPGFQPCDGRAERRHFCWSGPVGMPGSLREDAYLQAVQIETQAHRIGDTVRVVIERAGSNSLFGRLAERATPEARSLR